ncbi:efflux RND transporter periplasmic adaptor subunit [Wielerella bovis]|uniref:efflux RND transporter periplasmic adaptor subunit n=1 Tax=Wielerella bovis TaxID=2917790 RepID=UPI00201944D0|nr:efflux RND transporter periplasmic adaptor subunit [Wielerella bovis]ULJ61003.1 efflux RND transporter periplasmic adaptor subunit [Wielerella bovis]
MKTNTYWRMTALALAASLALAACGDGKDAAAQQGGQGGAAGQQAPAPTVSVVTVQPETVAIEVDLPGRLEAVRSAPIVPQVSGVVRRRLFQEGAMVRAGQPLYQIDDASFAANLENARASLLTAQAAAAKADADVARYRPLVDADAISKQEWDAALTAQRSAQAQIKAAQAAIRSAQVNVNHAHIKAPITGFIGQSLVTEGALVTANSTQMALITQSDYLYVNIKQSSGDILRLRQQLATGERNLNKNLEVGIQLEDGSIYEHKGNLMFADTTVDEKTSQVTLRAVVPNPEGILMSGMYARVKLPLSSVDNAFVVPQQAVTRGQQDIVMVVGADGSMQPRPVKVVGQTGSNWIISEGLQAGDKVIVEGIMIAGMTGAQKVQTKEWQPENAKQATSAGTAPQSSPTQEQPENDADAMVGTPVQAASNVAASAAE